MELGNQVSCKIRGGWAQGVGGAEGQPQGGGIARASALLCKKIRNTPVLPGWRPSVGHPHWISDTGWQECREGLLAFLLVDF